MTATVLFEFTGRVEDLSEGRGLNWVLRYKKVSERRSADGGDADPAPDAARANAESHAESSPGGRPPPETHPQRFSTPSFRYKTLQFRPVADLGGGRGALAGGGNGFGPVLKGGPAGGGKSFGR